MQSPQNCKRAPAWTKRETLDLIAVWGEASVQAKLRSKRRNANIFAKISQGMLDRGYNRDTQQCCLKVKELRQAYQKTKEANGCSGSEPHTCRFCDQLHGILGGDPTTTPPLSVDTSKGGVSHNREEDLGDEEEENAQQASGESVLPSSQDLFITLEPIPSLAGSPTPKPEKAPLVQMFLRSPYHLRPRGYRRLEGEKNALAMTCFPSSCSPPVLIGHSLIHGGIQWQRPGKN
nr:uncharacterized protein LOC125641985 [Caretta caretta]